MSKTYPSIFNNKILIFNLKLNTISKLNFQLLINLSGYYNFINNFQIPNNCQKLN